MDGNTPLVETPRGSMGARLAAALVGIVLMWLVLAHAKPALVGLLGVAAAWGVQRYRKRDYTRYAGWVGAVAGSSAAIIIGLVAVAVFSPRGTLDSMMNQASKDEARQLQQPPPAFLRRLGSQSEASRAAGIAGAQQLFKSRGAVVAMLAFGGMLVAAFGGFLVGSLIWACVTTLAFAAFGRWTFATGPPHA
ncbi:MAG: hypothetical protein ACREND_00095 [Gemmatimonadaceae bacterium]